MNRIALLSNRQIEVLTARAQSDSMRMAAFRLGITEDTIKNHLEAAYRALDVHSAIEAFRAIGWLRLPEEE